MTKRIDLSGIFPPIPTPFADNGELELAQLAANLKRWNEWPLNGYVVGGSNGEFVLLDDDERIQVVETARKSIPAERLLIAGSGAQSTRRAVELTRSMAAVGADAALVVAPSYYKRQMSEAAFFEHYSQVAEASPIPIILYNVPANTGLDLPSAAIERLAQHPNIVGLKDSGGDLVRIGALIEGCPQDFQVLAGGASFFLPALSVGAVGVIPALGNLAGAKLADIHRAFKQGELAKAAERQRSLIAANHAVTAGYGVPGLKAGLDMLGFYGGPVRSPLQPLSEQARDDLRRVLQAAAIVN